MLYNTPLIVCISLSLPPFAVEILSKSSLTVFRSDQQNKIPTFTAVFQKHRSSKEKEKRKKKSREIKGYLGEVSSLFTATTLFTPSEDAFDLMELK